MAVLVAASLGWASTGRAAGDPEELFARGHEAYSRQDFLNAALYLFAYIQQSPSELTSDPVFGSQVATACDYCRSWLENELNRCKADRARLSALEAGSGMGTSRSGLVTPPPSLSVADNKPRGGFVHLGPYGGDCQKRPTGAVCAKFDDGFVWLVWDSVLEWRSTGFHEGKQVQSFLGGRGEYLHVLDTDLVAFRPRAK